MGGHRRAPAKNQEATKPKLTQSKKRGLVPFVSPGRGILRGEGGEEVMVYGEVGGNFTLKRGDL